MCSRLRGSRPLDFGGDLFALGAPLISFGLFVAKGRIVLNGSDELAHAGETAVPDGALSNIGEEAFNEVEP